MKVPMKIPMRQWVQDNPVPDRMIWKGGADSQIGTWLDLCSIIGRGLSYKRAMACLSVVSTHRSKSIDLPVVQYDRPDIGLRLTMRDNFHDVKLSVESERPIGYADELACIFHTTPPINPDHDSLHSVYFEGFPRGLVFGHYSDNPCRWSAELSQTTLRLVLFFIMRSLGQIKPMVRHTPESYRAHLEAERIAEAAEDAEDKAAAMVQAKAMAVQACLAPVITDGSQQ